MTLKTAIVSILLATAYITATNAQAAIRHDLDIPAQELGPALVVLAQQARIQVVYSADLVQGHSTRGLSGSMTPDEALHELLAKTGLKYEFLDEQTVTLSTFGTADPSPSGAAAIGTGEVSRPKGFWNRLRLAQSDNPSPRVGRGIQGEGAKEKDPSSRQDESKFTELEEVVVTAQKRVERIQDVPVPVSVIGGEALVTTNRLRIEDYYTKIPGLAMRAGGNGGEPVVIIRGLVTGGDGANPTAGTVVDEISYGGSAVTGPNVITAADIDPGDLARVEVLRGPQGTLYGASSMGGLLKFVTVDPSTHALAGRVQAGTTSVHHSGDIGYSLRGSINVPLSSTLAVRASGFTLQDPGFVDNAETGQRDVNQRDSEGGRLAALWLPTDAFSLKLSALIQESERGGTADVDTALGREKFQQAFLPGTGGYSRDTQAYSATMVAKLGSVELTSATGYSVDEQFDVLDTTLILAGFPEFLFGIEGVDRGVTRTSQTIKKFSQELRASLPLGDRLTWLMGAFYTEERTFIVADNQAADATGAFFGSMFSNSYDPGTFEERALFTNLTVDLTDRWDIQFGGRYSENQQDQQLIFAGAFYGPDPIFGDAIDVEDSAFTYLVTPRFKVSEDLMIYARLASGYRPGGPNVNCVVDPAIACKFDADTTENYELGIKGSTPGDVLSYDASLYYIDWKDVQVPNILLPNTFLTYTDNVSRARSQGVELSVEARPLDSLTLSAWAAYNDAELTEAFPPTAILIGGSGDRLPYSSRVSGNVSLEQEFPLWGTANGSVGGSLSYVGNRKGSFQGAGLTRQTFPAYTQLDVHAGLQLDTWTVNAFVNNVTDKRGVLRGGSDAVFRPTFFTYIQPRTIGLSLAKSF